MDAASESAGRPRQCALFVTCLTDQFFPEVAAAAVRVLEHYGVRVHVPRGQTCCGQPVYNNGLWDQARAIGRRTIALLEPYPYVVLPSGSCAAMIREHYETLFEDRPSWRRRARALAARTYELVEFLQNVVQVPDWPALAAEALAAHYPCHLRGLGVSPEENRRPLGPVAALRREEQCCGFGGAFSFQFPALSQALLDDKLDAIQASGARTVIVNEAGCRLHLAGGARRRGLEVRFVHLVELLAARLEEGAAST